MGKNPFSFDEGLEEPIDPRQYEAFHSQDKVMALDIVRATGPGRCPSYAYLLDISYGRRFYEGFILFYTFMMVKVTGENLKEVIDAIKLRKCSRIQEFHAEDFDPPTTGAPVIRKIEVMVKAFSEALAESEKTA